MLQNQCSPNLCPPNSRCQSGFTSKGFRCKCTKGFVGENFSEGIKLSISPLYDAIFLKGYSILLDMIRHDYKYRYEMECSLRLYGILLNGYGSHEGSYKNIPANMWAGFSFKPRNFLSALLIRYIKYILCPSSRLTARGKTSLSLAQIIFIPANINSIALILDPIGLRLSRLS